MLLALSSAAATGLPWTCVDVASPAEARVYYGDGGLADERARLEEEIALWWDDGCDWEEEEVGDDGYSGSTDRTCTTDAGARQSVSTEWTSYGSSSSDTVTTVLELPAGTTTWSVISLRDRAYTHYHTQRVEQTTTSARWGGEIDGFPADAGWEFEVYGQGTYDIEYLSHRVTTPECSWVYYDRPEEDPEHVILSAAGHEIVAWIEEECGSHASWYASFDDVSVGPVNWSTWAAVDADLDGWSPESGDCDDANPGVRPCGYEVPGDGFDQDCDGFDDRDGDDDGHAAETVGGDDCDDADASVHPDAAETAGDGVDQDCDGADDTDADLDGYTSDGEGAHPEPDCDDADPAVHPDAHEVPYDGIDNDCVDADLADVDGDGHDADEAGGDDCDDRWPAIHPGADDPCDGFDSDCDGIDCAATASPVEPARGGCGGSGAYLLVFLLRRRR